MTTVIENFLRYVRIDTQSQPDKETLPSTAKQLDLARLLAEELRQMGAAQVRLTEQGYVYAVIPATTDKPLPTLGFVAHMDTSPAVSGAGVKPTIVHYDGGDILLNPAENIILSPKDYPDMLGYIGKDLIVTDGTTLLGADDKAGVAEIMAAAAHLLSHPEIPHGKLVVAFTPDEEVGRGVDGFDVPGFGADFAYTVDGGALGELEYENFNGCNIQVTINGISIHPGSAKGMMKNAILIAMELQAMLPVGQTPALTEGYEGFFHLDELSGTVECATMEYLIRDHDNLLFARKRELFAEVCSFLNQKYGAGTVVPVDKIGYCNMKEQILPHFHLIDDARAAMERLGITPIVAPIRGGTDGSRLSFMGLPCPNLSTGGHNFHGRFEYIPVQSLEKMVELLLELAQPNKK